MERTFKFMNTSFNYKNSRLWDTVWKMFMCLNDGIHWKEHGWRPVKYAQQSSTFLSESYIRKKVIVVPSLETAPLFESTSQLNVYAEVCDKLYCFFLSPPVFFLLQWCRTIFNQAVMKHKCIVVVLFTVHIVTSVRQNCFNKQAKSEEKTSEWTFVR